MLYSEGTRWIDLTLSWLSSYALHSTLLLALAWLASRWLRHHHLALEERVWKVALVGGIVTASLQMAWGVGLPLGTLTTKTPAVAEATAPGATAPLKEEPPFTEELTATAARPLHAAGDGSKSPVPASLSADENTAATPTLSNGAERAVSWAPLLLAIWLVGAFLATACLAISWLRFRRRLGDRAGIQDGPLIALLGRLLDRSARPRPVRLSATWQVAVPFAWGVRRPEICLPQRAVDALSTQEQESILAHELAHVVHRDPAWLAGLRLLEAVFFFQPLNRLARRRLQVLAEYRCDDWAVHRTGRSMDLARCLTEVAGWALEEPRRGAPRVLPVAGMAQQGSTLQRRVERLVAGRGRRGEVGRAPLWSLPALAALLLATVLFAPGLQAGTTTMAAPPEAPSAIDPEIAPAPPAVETAPSARIPAVAPTPGVALDPRPTVPAPVAPTSPQLWVPETPQPEVWEGIDAPTPPSSVTPPAAGSPHMTSPSPEIAPTAPRALPRPERWTPQPRPNAPALAPQPTPMPQPDAAPALPASPRAPADFGIRPRLAPPAVAPTGTRPLPAPQLWPAASYRVASAGSVDSEVYQKLLTLAEDLDRLAASGGGDRQRAEELARRAAELADETGGDGSVVGRTLARQLAETDGRHRAADLHRLAEEARREALAMHRRSGGGEDDERARRRAEQRVERRAEAEQRLARRLAEAEARRSAEQAERDEQRARRLEERARLSAERHEARTRLETDEEAEALHRSLVQEREQRVAEERERALERRYQMDRERLEARERQARLRDSQDAIREEEAKRRALAREEALRTRYERQRTSLQSRREGLEAERVRVRAQAAEEMERAREALRRAQERVRARDDLSETDRQRLLEEAQQGERRAVQQMEATLERLESRMNALAAEMERAETQRLEALERELRKEHPKGDGNSPPDP